MRKPAAIAFVALAAAVAPPASVASTTGAYTGEVEVTHGDILGAAPTPDRIVLRTADGPLLITDETLRRYAGRRVTVFGERSGGRLARPRVIGTRDHDPENEPSYPPATGPRKVAVLMASGASEATKRWSAARVEQLMFGPGMSVSNHVAGQSRGRATVEGDVLGWYTIEEPEGCDEYDTAMQAMEAAKATGVRFADYHYVMTMFPRRSCGYNGMAEVGGAFSYINGLPPDFRLLAHEFGHNLGLYHGYAHVCNEGGRPTTTTGTCDRVNYGDPFDVMGHAPRAFFSGFHRAQLGFIRPEEVRRADAEGVYTLRSINHDASGTKLLQVDTPLDPDGYGEMLGPRYYNVELRTATAAFDDFAPGDPIVNGVTIRVSLGVNWMWPSRLLDVTPGSPGGHGDAVIGVGGSFTEPVSGARFTLESLASGVGRVRLEYPPTAPGAVRAELVAEDRVALAWSPSTDAKGMTAYEVERDGAVVLRTGATDAIDPALPRDRTFTYRVIAIDSDGNRTASEPVTATTPPLPVTPVEDGAAPPPALPVVTPDRARPRLRLRPAVGRRGRRVPRTRRLTLLASDDRAGVRVRATLDGRLLRSASATRVSLLLPRRALRRRHRLTLTATDAAGNRTVIRLRIVRGRLLRR